MNLNIFDLLKFDKINLLKEMVLFAIKLDEKINY